MEGVIFFREHFCSFLESFKISIRASSGLMRPVRCVSSDAGERQRSERRLTNKCTERRRGMRALRPLDHDGGNIGQKFSHPPPSQGTLRLIPPFHPPDPHTC